MKLILATFFVLLVGFASKAQTVTYCISNEQTIGSNYEFDVLVKANTINNRLGDGIFYINYDTTSFGTEISGKGLVLMRDTLGAILGSKVLSIINVYSAGGLLSNNNSASRFAVAWEVEQMSFADTLLTTESQLLHVRMPISSMSGTKAVSLHEPLMEDETFESTNTTAFTVDIGTCVSLPVEGLSLTAEGLGGNVVALQWQTLAEYQSDYFVVEKRGMNGQFESIGQVQAAGSSLSPLTYQYYDRKAFGSSLFYRIQQVDQDGSFVYSNRVEVNVTAEGALTLFPNPVKDQLWGRISGGLSGPMKFSLFDLEGKKIFEKHWDAVPDTDFEIVLPGLPEGNYPYQLKIDRNSWSGKLIKQ